MSASDLRRYRELEREKEREEIRKTGRETESERVDKTSRPEPFPSLADTS